MNRKNVPATKISVYTRNEKQGLRPSSECDEASLHVPSVYLLSIGCFGLGDYLVTLVFLHGDLGGHLDVTRVSIDDLGQPDKPKGKMLAAIAYVVKRRENPDFTWEDALAIKITTTADKVDPDEGDE